MTTKNYNDFVCVPLDRELYQAIVARYPSGVGSLIEDVVWNFLERTAETVDDLDLVPQASRGYAWGSLFLPDRTEIRMKYRGNYHYAQVREDEIIYDGKMYSPSKLACKIANGTSRNAWISLWIKRPNDSEWHRADSLR